MGVSVYFTPHSGRIKRHIGFLINRVNACTSRRIFRRIAIHRSLLLSAMQHETQVRENDFGPEGPFKKALRASDLCREYPKGEFPHPEFAVYF